MNPLAIQIAMAVVAAFLAGFSLGWFVLGIFKKAAEEACRNELTTLHKRHAETANRISELEQTLQQTKEHNRNLLLLQEEISDNDDFHRVRTELEDARKQLDSIRAELRRREQQVVKLVDISKTLKKQLELRQQSMLKLTNHNVIPLPGSIKMEDDLLSIEGITPDIAHKLRSMGIINYRQLAECSPPQLQNIQMLIGNPATPLPLAGWANAARELFQTKYAHLFSNTTEDTSPLRQSRSA